MERKHLFLAGGVLLCILWMGGACVDPANVYVDAAAPGPGNGSVANPFPDIGSGMEAVAEGGTVHVAAGEYHENVVIPRPSTLQGEGSDRTRIFADMGSSGIEIQAGDVTVSGLAVACEGVPIPGEVLIAGVLGQNVNNLTLRDNRVGPYAGYGIAVAHAAGVLIENNVVQVITDQPAFLHDAVGIRVHMVTGTVRGNTSSQNVNGMWISGERGSEFELTVTGNSIEQSQYHGLTLDEADRVLALSDNAILNNGGPGIEILDETRYFACQIAGGSDCELPTTRIDSCSNNTQYGNHPDTLGGCFGGGGDMDDPCEDDIDCMDPLVCDAGHSNTCRRPPGSLCFSDSECVYASSCCYSEPPGQCSEPYDMCHFGPE